MKKRSTKKANIGDIIEISTPAGLAYVHYTHDGRTNGELVRILPGLYATRLSDFAQLAQQKELYFVFYIMNYAIRSGLAEIVSNQPIPEWAKPYPLMRHAAAFDSFGRVIRWRIVSAASQLTPEILMRTPLITDLTCEQRKLSIREIWPHAALVNELARGWIPERAEELHLKDLSDAAEKRSNQTTGDDSYKGMRHFFYFLKKRNAQEAGEELRVHGFSVIVEIHSEEKLWKVLATKDPPPGTSEEMDELREEMEGLAVKFGGEYDGWEAPLDLLNSKDSKKVN